MFLVLPGFITWLDVKGERTAARQAKKMSDSMGVVFTHLWPIHTREKLVHGSDKTGTRTSFTRARTTFSVGPSAGEILGPFTVPDIFDTAQIKMVHWTQWFGSENRNKIKHGKIIYTTWFIRAAPKISRSVNGPSYLKRRWTAFYACALSTCLLATAELPVHCFKQNDHWCWLFLTIECVSVFSNHWLCSLFSVVFSGHWVCSLFAVR